MILPDQSRAGNSGDSSEEIDGGPTDSRPPHWANGHVTYPTAKPLLPGLERPNFVQVLDSNILKEVVSFEVGMSMSVAGMKEGFWAACHAWWKPLGTYNCLSWGGSEIRRRHNEGDCGVRQCSVSWPGWCLPGCLYYNNSSLLCIYILSSML